MERKWNFGMPAKGQRVVAYRDVRTQRAGRTYTASYHVDNDGKLVLSSAWGSISAKAKELAQQKQQAERLLNQMLKRMANG